MRCDSLHASMPKTTSNTRKALRRKSRNGNLGVNSNTPMHFSLDLWTSAQATGLFV